MANNTVNPLTWNIAIVDPKTGFPTPEFQRKWLQQAAANAAVPSLSLAPQTVMANILAQKAAAAGVSMSALIDALVGNTPGGLLLRGASTWGVLAPGTNGQVLTIVTGVPAWV